MAKRSSLFQNLALDAFKAGITPRTKQSRDWFRKKARALGKLASNRVLKDEELEFRQRTRIGDMFMFSYDPKHKKTLPYYDRFPLIIAVGPAKGGFYGLNLHYLPPILRAKFFDHLMDTGLNNKKFDHTTRMKLNALFDRVGRSKYYKPTLKHYLSGHVRSKLAKVNPTEWEIALFLDTADFAKASRSKVYADSRVKARS